MPSSGRAAAGFGGHGLNALPISEVFGFALAPTLSALPSLAAVAASSSD
jgi:hypothetical protein